MEKINAVIIDDEQNNIDFLELMIQKYCSSFINIIGKSKTIIKGVDLINSLKPKLLFLDIKLNNGTSFDILDKIDNYNYKVIFVTAYDKFAIKAFKYRAIDYLLKPVDTTELKEAVAKALNRTSHIHSRIGHEEGAQVPEPRAPEWQRAVNAHFAWWDKIVNSKKEAGKPLTMTTEFGPANYMWTMPYTKQPLADQWAINVYMMQEWRKRYL